MGGTADKAVWSRFCSSNNASTVTDDIIQAVLLEAPFLPALNQIESSVTITMTSDVPSGRMVGTLPTSAPSVTVIPTNIILYGWETAPPGPWVLPDPFGPTTSFAAPGLTTTSVTVTIVPETSPTATMDFRSPFVPITVLRVSSTSHSLETIASSAFTTKSSRSASATGNGGAPTHGCIGRVEMLALIIVVLSSVVSHV